MKVIDLIESHKKPLDILLENVANDRPDIATAAREINEAMQEYMDTILLTEATTIPFDKIDTLFTNASKVSQGAGNKMGKAIGSGAKSLGRGVAATSKGAAAVGKGAVAVGKGAAAVGKGVAAVGKGAVAAGKGTAEALKKLNAVINKAGKRLQDTKPVQQFDGKVAQIIQDYKQKLGPDHKAVKFAGAMASYGKENPKKTAFIVAALAGLSGFLGSPAAGAVVGAALRGALGLAKGEKASGVIGGAIKMATIGAIAGVIGDHVFDSPEAELKTVAAEAQKQGVESQAIEELTQTSDAYDTLFKERVMPFDKTRLAEEIRKRIDSGANAWEIGSLIDDRNSVRKLFPEEYTGLKGYQQRMIKKVFGMSMRASIMKAAGKSNFSGSQEDMAKLAMKVLGLEGKGGEGLNTGPSPPSEFDF
jgi:hypothetical protein